VHVPKSMDAQLGEHRLDESMAGGGKQRLLKSRYASVSKYINDYSGKDSSRNVEQVCRAGHFCYYY
jgi:hypothetical protein